MKTSIETLASEENEEFNSEKNVLRCLDCEFETENIDELDDHILANHELKDEVVHSEDKFVIVQDDDHPARNTRKRTRSTRPKNLPKDIPRAKIIVKNHDPKFKLCDADECEEDGKPGRPPKRGKRHPSEPMNCELCDFNTTKKSVLATHMLNHSDLVPPVFYKCSQCPYQTKRKNDMPKHMLGHCSNDTVPLYKCSHCPYVTKRKGDLPKHEMNHADKSQMFTYKCTECEYFSKRKNDLHKHMLIHSDRQLSGLYKCLKCAYATDKVARFSNHVMSKCVFWESPISLEHIMLEDILATVDKDGVHVLLNESDDENTNEHAEFVRYIEHAAIKSGVVQADDADAPTVVEGETVEAQLVEEEGAIVIKSDDVEDEEN
ncbi:zinc finger autosomal protein-like isoform X2 [Diabrotica virgifera virgifera]|uniref:Zinc finger autosomal protein-like isoform X2 n=1 Tax=Diabrotica virgifera virgifera TaxID=50390 RepID=A0A6P7HAC6_DIAVI|nr:zinc finger autosomal protein-like isoform X2 [Diabrotica virgifera virgifera]